LSGLLHFFSLAFSPSPLVCGVPLLDLKGPTWIRFLVGEPSSYPFALPFLGGEVRVSEIGVLKSWLLGHIVMSTRNFLVKINRDGFRTRHQLMLMLMGGG
jgi:hypothetical protein